MKTIFDHLNLAVKNAFAKIGIADTSTVEVHLSDRPDLADFQCNAALQLARVLKQPPRAIAEKVVEAIRQSDDTALFEKIDIAGPGFINLNVNKDFLSGLMNQLQGSKRCGAPETAEQHNIVVDYGGPNVAKPLHVGHLRPAIIGEAVKRIARFEGHYVLGDVHLGDWGTPMGMLIAKLQERDPDLVYFDPAYEGDYPTESPVTVDMLNILYPEASTHFKADKVFADKARKATAELQDGRRGYRALWQHFVTISIGAMKKDYAPLNVDFDLWLGESDVHDIIPAMIDDLKSKSLAVEDGGALIVHVAQEDDKDDMPPMILVKKDGGYNYSTTDLATIFDRQKKYNCAKILYVVDTRQSLHFKQLFRVAAKAGYIGIEQLEHINFGTINGKDGKPYKTRDGGIMRLKMLIEQAREEAMVQSGFDDFETLDSTLQNMLNDIAVAAVKYGDLSTHRQSDYVFDVSAFVQAEGKTGPYVQYAGVRLRSIIEKIGHGDDAKLVDASKQVVIIDDAEKALAMKYLEFPQALERAIASSMPSILCEHVYLIARAFSRFYGECPVVNETDMAVKSSRVALCQMVLTQIDLIMVELLGIPMPEKMLRASDL